jgi:hypothetical protein
MSTPPGFFVEVEGEELRIRTSGRSGLVALLTVFMRAKFPDGPNNDLLLSPLVNDAIDAMAAQQALQGLPVRETDWSSPHVLTPRVFIEIARRMKAYREQAVKDGRETEPSLEALIALALKPHNPPPLDRLFPPSSSMTATDLDRLEALSYAATPGPWIVSGDLDDDHAMSAVAISTEPETCGSMREDDWPLDTIVAATLIQQPRYVSPPDDRWDENAALIAAARTHLSELIRLARRGLEAESADSG